jgi:hypothetical protein
MYLNVSFLDTEPKFVSLLRSPGIDSKPGQPYLTYRSARLYRLADSIPWNREHLQIRAQYMLGQIKETMVSDCFLTISPYVGYEIEI